MGDTIKARRQFDQAMKMAAVQGFDREVQEYFVEATTADPEMADAWLGRIACGDIALDTLTAAQRHGKWLHRETNRLGRTLHAEIQVGPYFCITASENTHLGLALASALTRAGQYDRADALLSSKVLDDDRLFQWRQLARVELMHVTGRWQDVLAAAAEELPPRATVMAVVTAAICALAAEAAAHLGQGRVALDWLDRVDIEGQPRTSARFGSSVLTSAISPAEIPKLAADMLYTRGMVHRQLGDQEQAQQWLSKATVNGLLIDAAKAALDDANLGFVITDEVTIGSRSNRWDATTSVSREAVAEAEALEKRAELLAEGRRELAQQVGLADVKKSVELLEDQLEARQMRLEAGLKVEGQTNHVLLLGPPGTGKSTTAGALGKIYAGLGIVRNPKVREVKRPDLCGTHIGESGPKTLELIEKSLGGILFMDELYTLVERHQGKPDIIGMEAVNQLLISLEVHRFDFCFMGAGYETELDEFLTVNPGLAGRFNRRLRFASYSPDEIVEIARRYGAGRDTELDAAAKEVFLDLASTVRAYITPKGEHGIDALANGRFARNVLEAAENNRDSRLVAKKRSGEKVTVEELKLITVADLESALKGYVAQYRDLAGISW